MSEQLYTRCPICQGKKYTSKQISPGFAIGHPCPCVGGETPGWALTGLTMGQVERMVELERALAGDPGVPLDRRITVIQKVREKLARLRDQKESS